MSFLLLAKDHESEMRSSSMTRSYLIVAKTIDDDNIGHIPNRGSIFIINQQGSGD